MTPQEVFRARQYRRAFLAGNSTIQIAALFHVKEHEVFNAMHRLKVLMRSLPADSPLLQVSA